MRLLLNSPGIDLDLKDTAGGTALHCACGNGRQDAVRMLLMAGAKLMVWDNEHQNPFHQAARSDEGANILEEMISLVEKKGGIVENWKLVDMLNDQDNQGQSVLHLAVDLSHYGVCASVVEKGGKVNLCSRNFSTPLHLAATTGNLEIVKLLVSHGADLEAQNIMQETPLHKAANFNRVGVIEYLLEMGCDIDVDDQDNTTPLMMAAYNGNAEAVSTVEVLLDHNADLSALDSSEKSAIYWAAQENAFEVLKLLLEKLEKDASLQHLIEQTDRFDNTPLHVAATNGFKHIVQLLIDHNADVDCANDEDLTPLHLAAISGKKKVSIALLTKQPNIINDVDESGNTALHLAALNGHNKLINLLIDFGAGVDPRNNLLWTPLDCAAAKGHVECVIQLLSRDSPIDPMDIGKITPLHLASRNGHAEVVKFLLQKGADVTIVNHEGRNALDMAVENSHREVALAILDHKDWLLAAKNRSRDGKGITTPMRQLIKKLPDVAYVLLNKCMKLSTNMPNDAEDFQVTFYYDLLDDTYADWCNDYEEGEDRSVTTSNSEGSNAAEDNANRLTVPIREIMEKKESHPLMIMCTNKCDKLLSHPLCLSLIYQKWQKFGRMVFYLKFFLYFIFLFFYTGFVLICTPLHARLQTINNTSVCVSRGTKADKEKINVIIFFIMGRIIVLILGFLQLILEFPQLISRGFDYVVDLNNLLEWIIYILAIIYAWPTIDHIISESQHHMDCLTHVTVGAIGIFFAWINLLLFIRKFPTLGIYVVMFLDVTKTFFKFSVTFILFIVAFALGFYTLLEDKFPLTYYNIGRAIVKTLVMMIGEFDFDDLFNGGEVHPPVITWLLFIVFVIIMTILLMNLMVGLAVDDIKVVLDQAAMTRISMQVHLVIDVEKSLPRSFRMRYISNNMMVYPNREFKWYMVTLLSHITTMGEIEEAIKPQKSISEQHTQSICESVEKLKTDVKTLGKQLQSIEHMMEKLLIASNVSDDDEDNNWLYNSLH